MLTNRERRKLLKAQTPPKGLPAPIRLPMPLNLMAWLIVAGLVPIAVPFLVFGMVLWKALYVRTNRY